MQDFEIIFYDKPDGTEPAKDFLLSLNEKMRARVVKIIELLSTNGPDLRMPYSEHLTDGIFEIRAKVGSDISRVLYFFRNRTESCADKWIYQENTKDTEK